MSWTKTTAEQVPLEVKWMHEQLLVAHLDLAEFRLIYTEDDDDLELLNSAGQLFFVRLHKLYLSSFIQLAGRLMDPAVMGISKNASLAHLVKLATGLEIHGRLVELHEQAALVWESLKAVRHKVIAHSDLNVIRNPDDYVLFAETAQVEELFRLASECVKLFYTYHENCQVSYGDALHPPGASLMLKYLKLGKAACDAEELRRYRPE